MNQRKIDPSSRDLVPYDPNRTVKAEPVYGEYYYGYAQSKSAQAKSYLQLLQRQRKLAIGVFAAVMVIGLLWLFTRTPQYKSTAEVLVTPLSSGGGGNSELIASNLEVMFRIRTVATQVKMMKSPDLLDAAFANVPPQVRLQGFGTRNSKLGSYPVTITNPKDTEIVGIEVLSQDPKAAAAFANEILLASMNRRQENARAIAEMATEQVSTELTETTTELESKLSELANLKRERGIPDLTEQTKSDAASLAALETAVSQAKSDLATARHRRETLARELSRTPKKVVSSRVFSENPTVRAIENEIEKLQQEKAAALLEYQPTAPEVRNIENRIAELKRREADMIKNIESGNTESPNPIHQSLSDQHVNSLVAIREAESRLAVMSAQATEMRARIKQLPDYEEKVTLLMGRIGELQTSKAYLTSQLQALSLSMRAILPNVVPITHARVPRLPVSPNIPVSMMMILCFAALAGVGAAVLRDQLDERIHTSDSLEGSAGYRVLASIPTVRNGFQGLVSDENAPSGLLENFRILRNNIFLTAQGPHPRVIVITSPSAGEGKSTMTANLAITTAMSHKRVLLIDGDLRHPSVHLTFGMSNEMGLSTVLQGEASLEECLQQSSLDNLQVLPAGPTPAFPPELLASPAMADLLATVREDYDAVLLDCTPVVNLSDGAQLASWAEGAIMVVSAARTERGSLLEGLRILEQIGVPVLGIVYNRSTETEPTEWTESAPKALTHND
ncbi:MAG: polysaccharide biosynthesis tyrosine autokinase [Armatimonadota bacterium]